MKLICPDGFTVKNVWDVYFEASFFLRKDGSNEVDVYYTLCCTDTDFDHISTTYCITSPEKAYSLLSSYYKAQASCLEDWEVPT